MIPVLTSIASTNSTSVPSSWTEPVTSFGSSIQNFILWLLGYVLNLAFVIGAAASGGLAVLFGIYGVILRATNISRGLRSRGDGWIEGAAVLGGLWALCMAGVIHLL